LSKTEVHLHILRSSTTCKGEFDIPPKGVAFFYMEEDFLAKKYYFIFEASRDYPLADAPSPHSTGGGTWKVKLLYIGGGFATSITVTQVLLYILRHMVVARRQAIPPPLGIEEATITGDDRLCTASRGRTKDGV
jgi:hypothetical protein